MTGSLRDMCEWSLTRLKTSGILRPAGVDEVWQSFVNGQDRTRWSRAFALCVLGLYLDA